MVPALTSADIKSSTTATADSGGNYAGPGGTITTGSASASVTTSNVSGSSSSSFYIKADAGGVVHEESHSSDSGDVRVKVTTTPRETIVETQEGTAPAVKRVVEMQAQEAGAAAEATDSTTATTSVQGESMGLGAQIMLSIQNFFTGLFGWFK